MIAVGPLLLLGSACNPAPSFSEGDCVRVERQLLDFDLESADCEGAVGTFDPNERVYRVKNVLDGVDASCPQWGGFFPVEFTHEPDGVTYCLVQES